MEEKFQNIKASIAKARDEKNEEDEKHFLNIMEIDVTLELMDQDKLTLGQTTQLEELLSETRLRLRSLGQDITERVEVQQVEEEGTAVKGKTPHGRKPPLQVKTSGGDVFYVTYPLPTDRVTGCEVSKTILRCVLKGPKEFGAETNATNIHSTQAVLLYGLPGIIKNISTVLLDVPIN